MSILRLVTKKDAKQLAEIYEPYVRDGVATLELEPPTVEEFEERIRTIAPTYPFFVSCEGERVLGYAYAAQYNSRPGYRYSVTTSVYLRPEETGKGLGKKLYESLLGTLKSQGYRNAYAVITVPNPQSVGLHEKLGFETVGHCHGCGYKLGQWVDVVTMEKRLNESDAAPSEPTPMHVLDAALGHFRAILGGSTQA